MNKIAKPEPEPETRVWRYSNPVSEGLDTVTEKLEKKTAGFGIHTISLCKFVLIAIILLFFNFC